MPYQIISPFVMPLDGDSFTNALKNYAKLNYMSNINQLIVTDQAQNMVANMKYYDGERGRRVKIGMEPTRHRRLASLSPRRDYTPAYGMRDPMVPAYGMGAPGGVMMGAPGGVMMGAPGIVLGAPSLDYAKLIKSKEDAIILKAAEVTKAQDDSSPNDTKITRLDEELNKLKEEKTKLDEAQGLVEKIKTTTEELKKKRGELATLQREIASAQPRPSIFGLPIPSIPFFR